jgi:hypothetical protein
VLFGYNMIFGSFYFHSQLLLPEQGTDQEMKDCSWYPINIFSERCMSRLAKYNGISGTT